MINILISYGLIKYSLFVLNILTGFPLLVNLLQNILQVHRGFTLSNCPRHYS